MKGDEFAMVVWWGDVGGSVEPPPRSWLVKVRTPKNSAYHIPECELGERGIYRSANWGNGVYTGV